MLNKFKNFFLHSKFNNKKYLLAVSGGVDSMVLLNIFNKLFKKNIGVAHCNFNLQKKNNINKILILNFCYKNNIFFFL
ncbi:MAG: hypothetical protein NHF89_00900 [Candidatus Shikimatogenerans bostrichidophilus]|nr:MAG: hypothetical protein NHF89_00900 [Candidatus Shikimatogenerans bostrichidophilus]